MLMRAGSEFMCWHCFVGADSVTAWPVGVGVHVFAMFRERGLGTAS